MKFTLILFFAVVMSGCDLEPKPDADAASFSRAMSEANEHDRVIKAQFRAIHNACEAAFEREVRAGGLNVLDYEYGPTGPLAQATSTGWKADIYATLTQTGRIHATCFTDAGYRVLDLQR